MTMRGCTARADCGLLNEIGQHFFGDLEVRDDPVFHRLDSHDVARRAPEHFFCFAATATTSPLDLLMATIEVR